MATNKLIKVFDNIGFNFQSLNNTIVPVKSLTGFYSLSQQHVGYYIPYICRNKKLGLLEIGIGDIKNDATVNVVIDKVTFNNVKRLSIITINYSFVSIFVCRAPNIS